MIVSATAPSPCKDCEDRCIGCHTTCGDCAEAVKSALVLLKTVTPKKEKENV